MKEDIVQRLRLDPGSRTLGQLLQDREFALREILQLRDVIQRVPTSRSTHSPASTQESTTSKARDPSALVRLDEVCQMVGVSRSAIYKWMNEGRFPKPVRVGHRAVRWRIAEVSQWTAGL